jgi:hypothetical protein
VQPGNIHIKNLAEYEGDIDIEEPLLAAMIQVTNEVANRVSKLGTVKES